jgi:2-octaprenyl-6-methoxyphenol hydroxylase
VQGLRGLGLYALDRIGPLRRAAMREGVAPHVGLPGLMQGERATTGPSGRRNASSD